MTRTTAQNREHMRRQRQRRRDGEWLIPVEVGRGLVERLVLHGLLGAREVRDAAVIKGVTTLLLRRYAEEGGAKKRMTRMPRALF